MINAYRCMRQMDPSKIISRGRGSTLPIRTEHSQPRSGARRKLERLRVETRASFLALENGKDTPAPIFILTDSANHLTEVDNWVGEGKSPTLSKSKDSDILRAILELLHHRARKGFPTFFIKI